MKKLFPIMLIMVIIYYTIQILFALGGYNTTKEYKITADNKEFNIKEQLSVNNKGEHDAYYFEIKNDNNVFSFQTYNVLKKQSNVIIDIKEATSKNYACILPIFKNNIVLTDILCQKEGITYNYNTIINRDEKIDAFANSIKEYNIVNYKDDTNEPIRKGLLIAYPGNITEKHYLVVNNYQGLSTVHHESESIKEYRIFLKDIYKRPLTTTIGDYYLTADYYYDYEFSDFYLIDFLTFKDEKIHLPSNMSFNSYIQGNYKNSVYVIDCENKVQYELNTKTKEAKKVGDVKTKAYDYIDGELKKVNIMDLINNKKKFDSYASDYQNINYVKIDKVGGKKTGYYYLYKQNGENYEVYRANIQNKDQITYLFTTTDMDKIRYMADTIYYFFDNSIKSYNDASGIKTLISNVDYEFNKDIFYDVYYEG